MIVELRELFDTIEENDGPAVLHWVCSFLPLIGLLTGFLPNLERPATTVAVAKERSTSPA
jgi:hypothetical protein